MKYGMKRSLLLLAAVLIEPAVAAPVPPETPPTQQQQLSQAKIQIGQLLVIEGNLELQIDKLQTENETLKKQLEDNQKTAAKPTAP